MQIERPRRLHNDHMSGNWSFGSNYQPCSQTRKMSIRIVVDSSTKTKSKIGNVVEAELHTSQNVKFVKDVPAESKGNEKESMSSDLGRQNKAPHQNSSPLMRTRKRDSENALNVNRKRDSEVVKQNTEGVLKDKTQKATDGRKSEVATMNASLFENRKRDSGVVQPNTEMKEKTPNYLDDYMASCPPGGNNGTTSKNDVDQNPFAKRSFSTNVDPQSDLKSPTFVFKSTTGISSPVSSFESDKEDLDADSPSANSFKTKQTRSSHSKGFSKEGHYNANIENPSPNSLPSPFITGEHKEYSCSGSPSEVMESQSLEDASPISVPIISKNRQGKKRSVSVSPCQEEDSESSEDDTPIKEVSYKKFLMLTEEAIETQLNDAHKRIADVHKMSFFCSSLK